MRISVLIPVYATPVDWVRTAIDSIINQDMTSRCPQIVIVDDNNPPGELRDYLYSLTSKIQCIHIIRREKNEGIAAALNSGLKECTGDVIVRMDADDIAHPGLLKSHEQYFMDHPDRHICGIQIELFSETKTWYSHHREKVTRKDAYEDNNFWFVNHPGIAYRKETITGLGGYGVIPCTLAEDYALWIKFLKAGYIIYNRPEVLMRYRIHPKSFAFAPDRKAPEWYEFLNQQKKSLYE